MVRQRPFTGTVPVPQLYAGAGGFRSPCTGPVIFHCWHRKVIEWQICTGRLLASLCRPGTWCGLARRWHDTTPVMALYWPSLALGASRCWRRNGAVTVSRCWQATLLTLAHHFATIGLLIGNAFFDQTNLIAKKSDSLSVRSWHSLKGLLSDKALMQYVTNN